MNTQLRRFFLVGMIVLLMVPASSGHLQHTEDSVCGEADSSMNDSLCDLLIIAPAEYVRALEPLQEHKQRMGLKTSIVTLDMIYDVIWYGRDAAEKIKLFIKQAYEDTQIQYVLLVGNFRKVPIRYVFNADSFEEFYISELYYADLVDENGSFSSWDSNNNGVFGEWKGDEAQDVGIDLYPEVCVGRLACRNVLEVYIAVSKIIRYETNAYGSEWFHRIVGVAGDMYPPGSYSFPTPGNEGEDNILVDMSYLSGFENTTLFTSDGSFTGSDDVIRAVNRGCGFLVFYGHGNPSVWSTHPTDDKKTWIEGLSLRSMARLRNKDMLPVCVVNACHNLQFDVNILYLLQQPYYYMTWVPECWGWKLTRMLRGGSIATIGYSGLELTKEDKDSQEGAADYLDNSFFYCYGVENISVLGEVWKASVVRYLDKYPIDWNTPAGWDYAIDAKTVQQWVLLGDPSLRIGGYPPVE